MSTLLSWLNSPEISYAKITREILPLQVFQILWRIATADCVCCCLRCIFCWSWNIATRPQECGHFSSPEEVAGKLIAIAKSKKLHQLRISGNEPTICREHLVKSLN